MKSSRKRAEQGGTKQKKTDTSDITGTQFIEDDDVNFVDVDEAISGSKRTATKQATKRIAKSSRKRAKQGGTKRKKSKKQTLPSPLKMTVQILMMMSMMKLHVHCNQVANRQRLSKVAPSGRC